MFLYLVVYFICRVEFAHWALKRLLQNSLEDLCSVWETMNNMITLQHTEIKASFETSTHVVEHVFKVTLYKRLLGMISRYALNRIFVEFECELLFAKIYSMLVLAMVAIVKLKFVLYKVFVFFLFGIY